MKREILFKGFRSDGKGWVYGDLNQNDVHNGVSIRTNGVIITKVIPETVCQYTGLKDNNGKMIFEGDILSDDGLNFGEVDFNTDMGWVFNTPHSTLHVSQFSNYCKVTGSIHDNKEEA